MRNQRVVIKIENPCHQQWDKMTPNEQGKFCDHCAKSVIDFTKSSDAELAKKFSSNSEQLCGRFDKDQLNRVLESKTQKSCFSPSKYLAGLVLLAGSKSSLATESIIPVQKTVVTNNFQSEATECQAIHPKDSLRKVIEGTVYDHETGETVPAVLVKIRNTSAFAYSDFDGKFFLVIPDSVDLQFVTIYTEALDADGEDVVVDRTKNTSNIDLHVFYSTEITEIGYFVPYKPRKWWQFWKKKY